MKTSAQPQARRRRPPLGRHNRGFVQVLLLVLFTLGAVIFGVLETQVAIVEIEARQKRYTPEALDQARAALLDFAFSGGNIRSSENFPQIDPAYNYFYVGTPNYPTIIIDKISKGEERFVVYRPGQLPCPDNSGSGITRKKRYNNFANDRNLDGTADYGYGLCSGGAAMALDNDSRIGRLPWRTYFDGLNINLGVGNQDFRDGNNDRLWYAVAPHLTDVSKPLNPYAIIRSGADSWLTLAVDHSSPSGGGADQLLSNHVVNSVAAIIISPGKAGDGETRETEREIFDGDARFYSKSITASLAANYLQAENLDANNEFSFTLNAADPSSDRMAFLHRDEILQGFQDLDYRDELGAIAKALANHYQNHGSLPDPATFERYNTDYIARRLGRPSDGVHELLNPSGAALTISLQGARVAYELSPVHYSPPADVRTVGAGIATPFSTVSIQARSTEGARGVIQAGALPRIRLPEGITLAISRSKESPLPLNLDAPIAEFFHVALVPRSHTGSFLNQVPMLNYDLDPPPRNIDWFAVIPANTPVYAADPFEVIPPNVLNREAFPAGSGASLTVTEVAALDLTVTTSSGDGDILFADLKPNLFANLGRQGYVAKLPAGSWLTSDQELTLSGSVTALNLTNTIPFQVSYSETAVISAGLNRDGATRLPVNTPVSRGSQGLLPTRALRNQGPQPYPESVFGKGFTTVTVTDLLREALTVTTGADIASVVFLRDKFGAVGYFPGQTTLYGSTLGQSGSVYPYASVNGITVNPIPVDGELVLPAGTRFVYPPNTRLAIGQGWFGIGSEACNVDSLTRGSESCQVNTNHPASYVHLPLGTRIGSTVLERGGRLSINRSQANLSRFKFAANQDLSINIPVVPASAEQLYFRIETSAPFVGPARAPPDDPSSDQDGVFDRSFNSFDLYPNLGVVVGRSRILQPQITVSRSALVASGLTSTINNPLGRLRTQSYLVSQPADLAQASTLYGQTPPDVTDSSASVTLTLISRNFLGEEVDSGFALVDERGVDLNYNVGLGTADLIPIDPAAINVTINRGLNFEFDISPGLIVFPLSFNSAGAVIAEMQATGRSNRFIATPFTSPFQPLDPIAEQIASLDAAGSAEVAFRMGPYPNRDEGDYGDTMILTDGPLIISDESSLAPAAQWLAAKFETDGFLSEGNQTLVIPAGAHLEHKMVPLESTNVSAMVPQTRLFTGGGSYPAPLLGEVYLYQTTEGVMIAPETVLTVVDASTTLTLTNSRLLVPEGSAIPKFKSASCPPDSCAQLARIAGPLYLLHDSGVVTLSVGTPPMTFNFSSPEERENALAFRFFADNGGVIVYHDNNPGVEVDLDDLRRIGDIGRGQMLITWLENSRTPRIDLSWTGAPNQGDAEPLELAPKDQIFAQNNPLFYAVAPGCRANALVLAKDDCTSNGRGLEVELRAGQDVLLPTPLVADNGMKFIAVNHTLEQIELEQDSWAARVDAFKLDPNGVPVPLQYSFASDGSEGFSVIAFADMPQVGEALTIKPPPGGMQIRMDAVQDASQRFFPDPPNPRPRPGAVYKSELVMTVGGFVPNFEDQAAFGITITPSDELVLGSGSEIVRANDPQLRINFGPNSQLSTSGGEEFNLAGMQLIRKQRTEDLLLSLTLAADLHQEHFTGLESITHPISSVLTLGLDPVSARIRQKFVDLSGQKLVIDHPGYAWQGLIYSEAAMTLYTGQKDGGPSASLVLFARHDPYTGINDSDPIRLAIPAADYTTQAEGIFPSAYFEPIEVTQVVVSLSQFLLGPRVDEPWDVNEANISVFETLPSFTLTNNVQNFPIIVRQNDVSLRYASNLRGLESEFDASAAQVVYAVLADVPGITTGSSWNTALGGPDIYNLLARSYSMAITVDATITFADPGFEQIDFRSSEVYEQRLTFAATDPLQPLAAVLTLAEPSAKDNYVMFSFGDLQNQVSQPSTIVLGTPMRIPAPFALSPNYCNNDDSWSASLLNLTQLGLNKPLALVTTPDPSNVTISRSDPCSGLDVTLTTNDLDSWSQHNARAALQLYADDIDQVLAADLTNGFVQLQVPVPVVTVGSLELYNGSMIFPETGAVLLARYFSTSEGVRINLPEGSMGNIAGASGLGRLQEVYHPHIQVATATITRPLSAANSTVALSISDLSASDRAGVASEIEAVVGSDSAMTIAVAMLSPPVNQGWLDTSMQDAVLIEGSGLQLLPFENFNLARADGNRSPLRMYHRRNAITFPADAEIEIAPYSDTPVEGNLVDTRALFAFPMSSSISYDVPNLSLASQIRTDDISGYRFPPFIPREQGNLVPDDEPFTAELFGVTVTMYDRTGIIPRPDFLASLTAAGVPAKATTRIIPGLYQEATESSDFKGFYQNLWIRLAAAVDVTLGSPGTLTLTLPENTLINPVAGTYLVPASTGLLEDLTGVVRLRADNTVQVSDPFIVAPPALVLPVGTNLHLGDRSLRFTEVRGLIAHSAAPLRDGSVACGIEGGIEIDQASEGVDAAANAINSPSFAISSTLISIPDIAADQEWAGSGHPCILLDDPENSDLDNNFVFGSDYGSERVFDKSGGFDAALTEGTLPLSVPDPADPYNTGRQLVRQRIANDQVRLIGGRPQP